MSLKRHACSRRTWLVAAWLAALFLFAAAQLGMPVCAQAQTAVASIEVEQRYTSDSTGVDKTFTYVLEPVTEGAPLPGGATGEYTWTMSGSETVTLEVPFETPLDQEYEYRMFQRVDSPKDGFTYDDTVYTLRLLFAGSEVDYGILIPYDAKGLKPNEVSWTVSYVAPPASASRSSLSKTGDTALPAWLLAALGATGLVLVMAGTLRRHAACGAERE